MTYFLSAFFFPLIALAVLFGLGLLVAAGGGNRVRPELVAPIGLGAVIVFGQFTAWLSIGTPVNVIAMVLLAIAGYVLLARKRGDFWPEGGSPRTWFWWLVPGVLAGGVVLATVIIHGNASMAGFLLDTTSTVQMLGGDFALHGSDNFRQIHPTDASSGLTYSYFGLTTYPYGSQIAYALLGAVSGVNLLWIYTPFMALMVTLTGFGLYRVARLFELARGWAAVAAFSGAVPAIVYANALQGSIKEIVFLPLLVLASLLLLDPLLRSTPRSFAVTGAIVATGAAGAIGLAAFAWVLPLAFLGLLAQTKKFGGDWDLRKMLIGLAIALGALFVAMLPKLGSVVDALNLAKALSETNASLAADPGNLLAPIHKVQAFGVWLGSLHRTPPQLPNQTWALIGVVFAAFALGLIAMVTRRMWSRVTWVAVMVVLWYALTWRGTMWLDSKLVVIASHMVMVVAVFGAAQLTMQLKESSWPSNERFRRYAPGIPAFALGAVILFGVLGSNGMQYLATGMLPTDRYKELETLNGEYEGQGPAFMPDFDENALFVVRNVGGVGPGSAFSDPKYGTDRKGLPIGYGHSADLDRIFHRNYRNFKMVIQRRGPQRSRPGADYDLVRTGKYYETYKKNDVKVVEHLPVGTPNNALGYPRCTDVKKLAKKVENDDSLKLIAALPTTDSFLIGANNVGFTGALAANGKNGLIEGAGTASFNATVLPGQNLWWMGTVTRPLKVTVDGKDYGEVPYSLGGDGNVSGPVKLPPGEHQITLTRGGGTPTPGGRLSSGLNGLFLSSASPSEPTEIDPAAAESKLCGKQVDWIEIVEK